MGCSSLSAAPGGGAATPPEPECKGRSHTAPNVGRCPAWGRGCQEQAQGLRGRGCLWNGKTGQAPAQKQKEVPGLDRAGGRRVRTLTSGNHAKGPTGGRRAVSQGPATPEAPVPGRTEGARPREGLRGRSGAWGRPLPSLVTLPTRHGHPVISVCQSACAQVCTRGACVGASVGAWAWGVRKEPLRASQPHQSLIMNQDPNL